MRALSCRALALALVATAAPSRAEERTSARVWLDWSHGRGTETCISAEEVVRDVEQLLDRRVFAPRTDSDRTLHVDVVHDVEPSRYAARMVLRSKSGRSLGTREIVIETSTCDDASEAFVLAISMLADLPRTAEETADEAPPAPARALPEPWRLQTRLGPALAVDGSGSVAPGAHVSAMLSPPEVWPFGLGVLSTLRSSSPTPVTRYVLSSTTLTATLCLPPHRDRDRRFELTGCAGPQATLHVGSGKGFAVDRTAVRTTFGGEVQVYAGYAVSPAIRLFSMLGLTATPQQVEVVVQDPAGNPRRVDVASHATVAASIGLAFDIF